MVEKQKSEDLFIKVAAGMIGGLIVGLGISLALVLGLDLPFSSPDKNLFFFFSSGLIIGSVLVFMNGLPPCLGSALGFGLGIIPGIGSSIGLIFGLGIGLGGCLIAILRVVIKNVANFFWKKT